MSSAYATTISSRRTRSSRRSISTEPAPASNRSPSGSRRTARTGSSSSRSRNPITRSVTFGGIDSPTTSRPEATLAGSTGLAANAPPPISATGRSLPPGFKPVVTVVVAGNIFKRGKFLSFS